MSIIKTKKQALAFGVILSSVILGITLILILILNSSIFENVSILSDERKCTEFLSNLDRISQVQDQSTVRRLIEESCVMRNPRINSENQLLQELNICNSRAQNLKEQENFIQMRREVCMICAEINTQNNIRISTQLIPLEQQNNILHSELQIQNTNDINILYFTIENSNISFQIHTEDTSTPC